MGLSLRSTGSSILQNKAEIKVKSSEDYVIALAGNPNTGKSTVFNRLTGLNQHTGNWPGKTVTNAQGRFIHKNRKYTLVDLPGTYSLSANSVEEQVARDFILFGNPRVTVVVVDATCLERNLNLVLQILEITSHVVVCINLMDEAMRKKININIGKLSNLLGVPVVGISARTGNGMSALKEAIIEAADRDSTQIPIQPYYDIALEKAVGELQTDLKDILDSSIKSRGLALHMLLNESVFYNEIYLLHDSKGESPLLKERLYTIKGALHEGYQASTDLHDHSSTTLVTLAEKISCQVSFLENSQPDKLDRQIDNILTSKRFGIPIMIALLGLVLWLTIKGANIPSALLASGLFWLEERLSNLMHLVHTPVWFHDLTVLGVYRTLAWVVSVMLPPMAIFFPLFTLLEDLGYLPRIAFNLDHYIKRACAHGKQALTMCMGFGCNAAGVIACRIIDSPRERLIASITNNYIPCNGRFPILIALSGIFIAGTAGAFSSLSAALIILGAIVLGVIMTLFISKMLSKTLLKGLPSSFTLELPPYRKPQIGKILVRSIMDRTLFVLGRAVAVAAPAGLVIWLMSNFMIEGTSLLAHCALFLDPFARLLGLDGYILMAFILGLPANEIVIPILIMSYMSKGSLLALENLSEMRQLFINNGWTLTTAICTMLFTLNHWPCATTLWTIRKETGSLKWTLVSFLVPTMTGIIICFTVAQGARLLVLLLSP